MIGIICAIDKEVKAMLSHMDHIQEKEIYKTSVYEGSIANHNVVVAFSGVGKVNAAITTTLLANHYDIKMMINVGVAGGLLAQQSVGDIVIASKVIQHDFDTSAIDGEDGLGITSECDEALANKFKTIVENESATAWIGDVASGDCFVTRTHYFERIRKLYPSCVCAEMEAGAIAQTCQRLQIPCLIIRSLSDVAPHADDGIDFVTFAQHAAYLAGNICTKFITQL